MGRRWSRLLLLALVSCMAPKVTPAWRLEEAGLWEYHDEALSIRLDLTTARQYRWTFRNHRGGPLAIDHRHLAIFHADDPTAYTLWGESRDHQRRLPETIIQPETFLVLEYPIQYRSPLHPFEPEGTVLRFTAVWPDGSREYVLPFPGLPDQK